MLIKPNTLQQLSELIKLLKECNQNYIVIGNGSNLLISSNGYDGIVVLVASNLSSIEVLPHNKIYCEAGVTLSRLCKISQINGFSGAEFAFGIPGSVGGAVYMNAGAYDGEIKDILYSCTFIDESGEIVTLPASELDFSYRHSIFTNKKHCILSAIFSFTRGEKSDIKEKMYGFLESRKSKQPLEFPSAGSTFKRPVGSYASLLIEQCGLKGYKVGGAMVSTKHSGFIVNYDNATSDDVLQLIENVKTIVLEKTGYSLECEIRFIGK